MSKIDKKEIPESVLKMKKIMKSYYFKAKFAKLFRRKIAWITSGGPVEPLIAMGIIPVYPENHGAMIGAAKMGNELCQKADEMGYSSDLCSYARADIVCSYTRGGPIGGLPSPDMLICCNNICGTVLKWYEIQARRYRVPLFIFDTPFVHTNYTEEARYYLENQVSEYIDFLEKVTGRKASMKKVQKAGSLSVEAMKLWQKILNTAVNRPSPMTAFDAFFYLALIVTLRGTKVVVDFYKFLLEELTEKVEDNIGAIPDERYRLLWDNLPIWYKMRWLSNKFKEHNASLVADTYTTAWCDTLEFIDENNFIQTLGDAYSQIYLNIGVDKMADKIIRMIDKYQIDGVVMHSNRSCKPYSFGQLDIQKIIYEKRRIPTLLIEADMTDGRKFSDEQVGTRIDFFMEVLKERKRILL